MDKKEAEQAFIDAALSLANETCAHAFVCPVPNTTPKLYVAMGEADQIKNLLRLSIETSAAETNPRQEKGSSGQKNYMGKI